MNGSRKASSIGPCSRCAFCSAPSGTVGGRPEAALELRELGRDVLQLVARVHLQRLEGALALAARRLVARGAEPRDAVVLQRTDQLPANGRGLVQLLLLRSQLAQQLQLARRRLARRRCSSRRTSLLGSRWAQRRVSG